MVFNFSHSFQSPQSSQLNNSFGSYTKKGATFLLKSATCIRNREKISFIPQVYSRFKCPHQKFIPPPFYENWLGWRRLWAGALQCPPPRLRLWPALSVATSCFLIIMQPGDIWQARTITGALLTSWKLTSDPGSASRQPLMVPGVVPGWPDSAPPDVVTDGL